MTNRFLLALALLGTISPASGQTAAPAGAGDAAAAPAAGAPLDSLSRSVLEEARRARGLHLVVSLAERRLWLRDGAVELYEAPVAVGKSVELEWEGRRWNFETPRGERRVLLKEEDPVWTPPDWHYVEMAALFGLKLARLHPGRPVRLEDGSRLLVRGGRVGRAHPDGRFEAVPRGEEAVFDGTLYVPPTGTANRRLEGELGRYKLDMGNGYYLHGTPLEGSIGGAGTHGCIRLLDPDLEFLYRHVPVGTRVFIY